MRKYNFKDFTGIVSACLLVCFLIAMANCSLLKRVRVVSSPPNEGIEGVYEIRFDEPTKNRTKIFVILAKNGLVFATLWHECQGVYFDKPTFLCILGHTREDYADGVKGIFVEKEKFRFSGHVDGRGKRLKIYGIWANMETGTKVKATWHWIGKVPHNFWSIIFGLTPNYMKLLLEEKTGLTIEDKGGNDD